MAIDGKYGRVTLEHGDHIPDDEPVFVFRSKDELLLDVLAYYRYKCEEAGSPQRHLDLIQGAERTVEEWQRHHSTKVPDSETSRAWMA